MSKTFERKMSSRLSYEMKKGDTTSLIRAKHTIGKIREKYEKGEIDLDKIRIDSPAGELSFGEFLVEFMYEVIDSDFPQKFIERFFLPFFKELLESGFDLDINRKNQGGLTLLHAAAWYRMTSLVKLLLEKGIDVNAESEGGKTALGLIMSLRMNTLERLEIIKLLFDKGVEIQDDKTMSEIHFSVETDTGNMNSTIYVEREDGDMPFLYLTRLFAEGIQGGIFDGSGIHGIESSEIPLLLAQKISYTINFLEVARELAKQVREHEKSDAQRGIKNFCEKKVLKVIHKMKVLFPYLLDLELVAELENLADEILRNYSEDVSVMQVNFFTDIEYDNQEFVRSIQERAREKVEEKNKKNKEDKESNFAKVVLENFEKALISGVSAWVVYDQFARFAEGDSKNLAILDLLLPIIMQMKRNIDGVIPFGDKPNDDGDPDYFGGGDDIAQIASGKEGDEDFFPLLWSDNSTHFYE